MFETAEQLELEGVGQLVEGSSLSLEQLHDRAIKNCYIHASDALELGLIEAILD